MDGVKGRSLVSILVLPRRYHGVRYAVDCTGLRSKRDERGEMTTCEKSGVLLRVRTCRGYLVYQVQISKL